MAEVNQIMNQQEFERRGQQPRQKYENPSGSSGSGWTVSRG
jgi:hypothetical protein